MEIIVKDLDRYSKEFYFNTRGFCLEKVLTKYQLPNTEEIHSMICGYKNNEFYDKQLFDYAESIDYFKYEKELWKIQKPK